MFLAYVLLFLLHLSASACDATSRNHRLFLGIPGTADVPAPAPAIHDHRRIAKDLSSYDAHDPYAMIALQGGTPLPSLPGVEVVRPPDKEISAAMASSPSPSAMAPQVDNGGYGELGGDVGGGDGGSETGSSSSEEANATADPEERSADDDVGIDYAAPRTHPPSNN